MLEYRLDQGTGRHRVGAHSNDLLILAAGLRRVVSLNNALADISRRIANGQALAAFEGSGIGTGSEESAERRSAPRGDMPPQVNPFATVSRFEPGDLHFYYSPKDPPAEPTPPANQSAFGRSKKCSTHTAGTKAE